MDQLTEMTGLKVESVDAVEDPANGVGFLVVKQVEPESVEKREFSVAERRKLAQEGKAMPNGSFPIENREDLQNAIRSIGLTKLPKNKVRRFIMRRAKDLGAEDLIPKSWKDKEMSKAQKGVLDSNMGDGRGLLDWGATLAAVQAGIDELKASIAEMRDAQHETEEGTDGAADPAPAEKAAELKRLMKEARKLADDIEANQGQLAAERMEGSTGEAGAGAERPEDELEKARRRAKRLRKRVKRFKKAMRKAGYRMKDKKTMEKAKAEKTRKARKSAMQEQVQGPLTNVRGVQLQQPNTFAAAVAKSVEGMSVAQAAAVRQGAFQDAMRVLVAQVAPKPFSEVNR